MSAYRMKSYQFICLQNVKLSGQGFENVHVNLKFRHYKNLLVICVVVPLSSVLVTSNPDTVSAFYVTQTVYFVHSTL
jgi:hypothetical protein